MFRRFAISVCLLALASCGGGPPLGAPGANFAGESVEVIAGDKLPPPERSDLVQKSRPYYVGPYDILTIDVYGIEEFKARDIQVDTGGRISFPLVGTVTVAGQTPTEIEAEFERRLAEKYVRNPHVTVNLKEIVSQVVTVEGQVKKPGQFPVAGQMTLLRAIAKAEGTDEFAKLDDIVVFRTVQGRNMAALYNLTAIRRGYYADPELFANDVVVVGNSKARRLFKDFIGVVPLLTTPLIIALQNL